MQSFLLWLEALNFLLQIGDRLLLLLNNGLGYHLSDDFYGSAFEELLSVGAAFEGGEELILEKIGIEWLDLKVVHNISVRSVYKLVLSIVNVEA